MEFTKIQPGMEASLQKTITEKDAALNFGSGALTTLLATPTLSALMIEAAVKCIDENLPDGYISIGKALAVRHDNPTVVGMTVTVKAKIEKIEGNKVMLIFDAFDEIGHVGIGKQERFLVKKNIVLEKAQNRCKLIQSKNY